MIVALLFAAWPQTVSAAKCFVQSDEIGHVCEAEPPQAVFSKPQPFADSFLPYQTYARLNDNVNVYAGPSGSSGIVRNVGMAFYTPRFKVQSKLRERFGTSSTMGNIFAPKI